MRGVDVQAVFEAVLPDEALDGLISASRLQERERKLDARRFIRSAVIAASSGHGGRQAAVLRQYFEAGGPRVVRGAGYHWYLTNLPANVSPGEIRKLYAVRWEIELDNKVDKSCHRLDEIGAQTASTVRALVHASVVASVLVCLLAHHHRMEEGPAPKRTPYRDKPPIHPQTLARMVGTCAGSIAAAFEKRGKAATEAWNRLAEILLHCGADPNWRARPSVLDQLRGWKIRPGRQRRAKAGVRLK